MLWKTVTGLIVLFWIVMTTMLVKQSYFPDERTAKVIPVNSVLDHIALHQAMAGGSDTMQLLRGREASGEISVAISQRLADAKGKRSGFNWHAGGRIANKTADNNSVTNVAWNLEADQKEDQSFERFRVLINSKQTGNHITLEWKLGDEMPKIEVMQNDKLVMDTKGVLEEAKKQGSGGLSMGGFSAMMPGFLGSQKISLEHFVTMQAREDMVKIGQRKVRGSTLTLSVLGLLQTKIHVTDGGEITEIEMPNQWRALAMQVLGMEPEVKRL